MTPRAGTSQDPSPLRFLSASIGYPDRVVVRGVTLEVRPGEFVGLVGPNGAGKSTLLRAVTGGAHVTAGDITVGASVVRMQERERARLIGVVPQSQASVFAFSARTFVEMGRHPHLGRLAALGLGDHAVVDEVMRRTDTARLADERVGELSGGDLQRLTLAQALAQQPRVLLLDEPTSHLDLNHALQVLDLVRALADGGMAVLGVFHDLGIAARYADRISIVADGHVTAPRPPAEALDASVVSDVFGVRAVVRTDPVTGAVAVTPVLRGADISSSEEPTTVGLVCGSGTGATLMRRIVLSGHAVFAGALNNGDLDAAVAEALGVAFVPLPAFGEIDGAAAAEVTAGFAGACGIIVCPTPFGRANLPNLQAAIDSQRPLVLVGSIGAERDFTGGEAKRLWDVAVHRGAVEVDSESEALAILVARKGDV